ncbi:uncharacterized protein LOC131054486 [Cryptomeria japonica]|uniref:uncharacterized protein LOC131054486 n=1 Tax=Cryptomeria japonica TaxID=3369 RepID=UPI0027DA335D|nr:uncharacterized protein LOC131054486 [Cryptomeria japonica]
MREPNIQRKKLTPKKPTPKVSDILSPEELINEITQDGNLSNINKCYHTFKDYDKGTIEESIILHLDIYKRVLFEVIDDLPNDLYLRLEAKRMSIMELENKLKVEALLVVHPVNSLQEIDELNAEANRSVFASSHWQKSDKGKNKVGGIPDLTIKNSLPPPAEDTPPVVEEKQVEEQEKEQKIEPIHFDTQQKVEKLTEKEPEHSIAELTVSKAKSKDDSKVEKKVETHSKQKEETLDKEKVNYGSKIAQVSIDKIKEETIRERVNKEKTNLFNKFIKDYTGKLDSLIPELNSTILEFKELYRDVCKPHHLTVEIDDHIKQMQKEIDDIANNVIGSSELTSVLDQEMAVYEEKIENLEKEKARLRLKSWELKNKLGPRLDNLLTHQNGLSKATIPRGRSPEEQMHHLTSTI